jgi:Family of unknown function (DUF5681)
MIVELATASRTANGRFASGQSGNPAGRPKGSRNRATVFAEQIEEGQDKALAQAGVERALAGETAFLRVCLNLLFPKPKMRRIALDLSEEAMADPKAIYAETVRLMCLGEIAPDEALAIARVLAMGMKIPLRMPRPVEAAETPDARPEPQDHSSPACGGGQGGGSQGSVRTSPPPASPRKQGEDEEKRCGVVDDGMRRDATVPPVNHLYSPSPTRGPSAPAPEAVMAPGL